MAMLNNQRVWVITMVIMGNNLHSFEDYPSIINWLTNNHSWLPYSAMVITSIVSRFPIFSLGVATLYPHDENTHLIFFFFFKPHFPLSQVQILPKMLATHYIPGKSHYLVGGFKHFLFSFHIWDVILPIDELHHFSQMVGQPPTRWLIVMVDIIVVNIYIYINHILTIY